MPAIITNKFRIHNADQFTESFSEAAATTYYLAIGNPIANGTKTRGDSRTDNSGSDIAPLTPADSITEELYTYDDYLAAKRVTSSDVSNVVARRNWATGTVYDYYRHDYGNRITGTTTTQTSTSGASTLWDSTFYVLNSSNNVYKCLDNNGGANSTVEPTGTSTSILTTGDGYKWKYMYSLSATQQANFLSTDFMAVSTNSTVSAAAVNGAINIVKIKTAGSGGTNGTHANVNIRGDGSGGKVSVTVSSGAVSAVTVTNVGTGYTYGYIRLADIVSAGATNLTGTELDCIIEPKGGHGKNAIQELGGFFVMLNTNLEGAESSNTGDFTTANDFRRVALLRNPLSGGSAASVTTLRAVKAIAINSSPTPGTFTVDEEINQASTGAVGKVVEWDSTNRILYYVQTRFNDEGIDTNGNLTAFSGANVITGQSSSATGTPHTSQSGTVDSVSFSSGYANPELDADSGDVLYIENRAPITRAADQTENVKLIIEF
tara:strand:- start:3091 stop:4560 length:1470 start_codon:yes stop_codon:yes gene_type:complete